MSTNKLVGYRELNQNEIDLINGIKEQANNLGELLDYLAITPEIDQRWLCIAKTDLQKGMMFLVRAVAKPQGF